jgi:hypothetical protein
VLTLSHSTHIVVVGDIVNGATGEIIQTNPYTDTLRSVFEHQFEKVSFSREHACCLLGQPANFSVDGSYHQLEFDDCPNRRGVPWGALLNSSHGFVFLTFLTFLSWHCDICAGFPVAPTAKWFG